jgi:membrane-bound serine protease (ClpP class)
VRLKVRWIVAGLLITASLSGIAQAAPRARVEHLSLEGVVDPFEASYLATGIQKAQKDGAGAVLITIDTPGGLDSSMRKVIQAILAARIPVICFVWPQGARAASAGAFILMSCPVAAMAPGTNVGAAHPVGVSGAVETSKVTNDAVAFIRGLAEERGRNADWAEKAVRASASVSATEAVRIKAADLIASSPADLLRKVDGRQVSVGGGKTTLHTAGAAIVDRDLGTGARLLHPLFTPNFAFLFFYLGLALIVLELLHPGISVPGILGALSLVLAGASLGMLPVQLIGVVLLIASVVFFLLELKHPGLGVPTLGGLVTLILGGLLLFDRSIPGAAVSPGVIAPVAIGLGLFFGFVVKAALRTRHLPPRSGPERMLGAEGVATTSLDPSGVVRVGGETWSAESTSRVRKGTPVRVTGIEGLRLKVEPSDEALPAGVSQSGVEPAGPEGAGPTAG